MGAEKHSLPRTWDQDEEIRWKLLVEMNGNQIHHDPDS